MRKWIMAVAAALIAAGMLAGCAGQGAAPAETEAETAAAETPGETVPADETEGSLINEAHDLYVGTWVEASAGDLTLTIGPAEAEGWFSAEIVQNGDLSEREAYTMTVQALADGGMYYEDGAHLLRTYADVGSYEEEVVDDGGSGTFFVWDNGTLDWTWNDSEMNTTERSFVREGERYEGMPNPWTELTAEEAAEYLRFQAPEGAENVHYAIMEVAGEEPLAEMRFDLDGKTFNARSQQGVSADTDIAGMYYEWSAAEEGTVWGSIPCVYQRAVDDQGWADLMTWYDTDTSTAYSLSVTAPSLDGFDLTAVAEMIAPQ